MELNFNSVEMSREPRAEASSLDYAEAKLTFNSVETIPNLNASAAFQVDSGKVFKEDTDISPEIVGNLLQDGQIVSHVIQKCVFIGLWVNFQPAN